MNVQNLRWCCCVVPAALVVSCCISSAFGNLLVNGDAESGPVSDPPGYVAPFGWDTSPLPPSAVPYQDQITGRVYPHSGNLFFSYAWNAPSVWMSQSGTEGLDQAVLHLSGWVQVEDLGTPPDTGEAILLILDSADSVIATASSGPLTSETFVWVPFEVGLPVPPEAAKWTVNITGTLNYGSYVNVFFDGLELVPVPEPGTICLMALGGLALIRRWRW